MKPKIFYSWQSQDEDINRYVIRDALKVAANAIALSPELYFEPRLDEGTKDVAGWPDVMATILEKIRTCDVFVADVTVMRPAADRLTPNPNVMFELGYAFAKLDSASIILVMNKASFPEGKDVTDMPFDIRGRRGAIDYTLREEKGRKPVVADLAKILEGAIKVSMTQGPLGQIASFLAETNPEIIRQIEAGSRTVRLMVAQHRLPMLERMKRPLYERFVKITSTGSSTTNNSNRIGGHINDLAEGAQSGFSFELRLDFELPQ